MIRFLFNEGTFFTAGWVMLRIYSASFRFSVGCALARALTKVAADLVLFLPTVLGGLIEKVKR